jgi:hypothetical protein
MDWNSSLFILCSLAGLLMLLGSLYLLWARRIHLSRDSSGVTEFEVLGFKVKTPVPALVMFVLGVVLVVYPIERSPHLCPDLTLHKKPSLELVTLRGKAAADTDVEVYAIVDEQPANASDNFTLSVPYVQDRRYVIRYTNKADRSLLDEEHFRLEPGEKEHQLRGVRANLKVGEQTPAIKLAQAEPKDIAAAFK